MTHIFPHAKNANLQQKTPKIRRFQVFRGAAGRIRTADLILTKRLFEFFLTIFCALWPYLLQSACFPSLFECTASIYSAPHCG
ncbi:hypothetical protein HMPREF1545_01130 [Oscillibacter sp. KLE 1728]|nr:hypothetical protein HMPREF1546_03137 [Oscillibacter sp. KLE 1745]ERK62960.1 hypothetical protein HMPREF1545_01130 [Oscillibacter sp. KLE 1728]